MFGGEIINTIFHVGLTQAATCGTANIIVKHMCWVGGSDLVIIDSSNNLKEFQLDAATTSCTLQKTTYLGFTPHNISCTDEGEVYMARYTNPIKISIFKTADGSQVQWYPNDLYGIPSIAINTRYIVLSTYYYSHVYNRDRSYVNRKGHSYVVSYPVVALTTNDYSWYYADRWTSVSITRVPSLITTSLSLPTGAKLRSLTATSDGNVIASLFLSDSSDRFALYTASGTFLRYLQFGTTGQFSTWSVVRANNWQTTQQLVALRPAGNGNVGVYRG